MRVVPLLVSLGLLLPAFWAMPVTQGAPQVTGITPPSGDTNGGIPVVISGSQFVEGLDVTIGDIRASVVGNVASNQFTVLLPPRSSTGAFSVVVTNPDGSSTTITNGFGYLAAAAPTVGSVSPTTGSTNGGYNLTITGTNFPQADEAGFRQFRPEVTIGGIPAEVVDATETTSLKVRVPAHPAGLVNVTVTNPDGRNATKAGAFTYKAASGPSISEIINPSGSSAGGAVTTIEGTNFVEGAVVTIGGTLARSVDFVNSHTLSVVAPPNKIQPPNASNVTSITIQNPDGQRAIKPDSYVYTQAAAPNITAGPQDLPLRLPTVGGSLVCLEGHHLPQGTAIHVGGALASEVRVDDETTAASEPDDDCAGAALSFRSPLHATGLADIVATSPDGQTSKIAAAVQYVNTVAALGISPKTGSCNGGTTVTVAGIGFVAGARVFFDVDHNGLLVPAADANADGVVDQANEESLSVIVAAGGLSATAVAPPSDCSSVASDVDIVIFNGDGRVSILQAAYDYSSTPAPKFVSINPSSGSTNGGLAATVTGMGFTTGPVKPRVFFGEQEAAVDAVTATTLKVTVPTRGGDVDGPVDITVANPGLGSVSVEDAFTYDRAADPSIKHFASPVSSTTTGGGPLMLQGTGFATGSDANGPVLPSVLIGGIPATVTSISSTTMAVVLPPMVALGAMQVRVVNPNGDVAVDDVGAGDPGAETVLYTDASAPIISSLTPANGKSGGRGVVQISGTGFSTTIKPVVTFDGRPALVTSASANLLTVLAPAATGAGPVDIEVTNPDGKSALKSDAFTYHLSPGPAITAIGLQVAPSQGPALQFVVTGSNFASALEHVKIGGTVAQASVINDKTILVTLPAHAPGLADVDLRNLDGQGAALSEALRFLPVPPRLESITMEGLASPYGSTNGGSRIDVSGERFTAGMALFMGGSPVRAQEYEGQDALTVLQTPSHAAGIVELAAVDEYGQTAAMPDAFTFVASKSPMIHSVFPASGPALGGTVVNVTGTGFEPGLRLRMGGFEVAASDIAVHPDGTWLLARTPSHVSGRVTLNITNPDGQGRQAEGAYLYLGPGGAIPPAPPPNPPAAMATPPPAPPAGPAPPPSPMPEVDVADPPSRIAIEQANHQIELEVTRLEDANLLEWTLPADLPATVQGIQLWRANSPYEPITALLATTPEFLAQTYTDQGVDARETTRYLVTMFYGFSEAHGFFGAGSPPEATVYPGTAAIDAAEHGPGISFWVLLLAGLAGLALLTSILMGAMRRRGPAQAIDAENHRFAWDELAPQPNPAATGASLDYLIPALAASKVRCPSCQATFARQGGSLNLACPSCGQRGVARS